MMKEVKMSKQSCLDWLIDQVHSEKYQNAFGPTYISLALIVEAEQMHKEEIADAYNDGNNDGYMTAKDLHENVKYMSAEDYYNKLY